MTTKQAAPRQYAQFAHLNAAAIRPKRTGVGRDKRWTPSQLLDEASRVPSASKHVRHPEEPVWLKGSRKAVEARAAAWRSQAREANGRARLRSTSPSLACAVVSWPREWQARWVPYRDAVLAYFERKLGADRIPGAVEHLDESNQHIHVFFVPRDGEDFGATHPGVKARRRARQLPGNHVRLAFVEAMRTWQSELWEATGRPFGLERFGPRRNRWSRVEANAKKKAQELVDQAALEAEQLERAAQAEAASKSRKAEADQQRADERLAEAKRVETVAAQKWHALKRSESVFNDTPAGQHQAALGALNKEVDALRSKLAAVERENDAFRFRLAQQKPSSLDGFVKRAGGPKPPGFG